MSVLSVETVFYPNVRVTGGAASFLFGKRSFVRQGICGKINGRNAVATIGSVREPRSDSGQVKAEQRRERGPLLGAIGGIPSYRFQGNLRRRVMKGRRCRKSCSINVKSYSVDCLAVDPAAVRPARKK